MESERRCPPSTFTLGRDAQREPTRQRPASKMSQRPLVAANARTLPPIPSPTHYPQQPANADKREPSNASEASAATPLPTLPCASRDARRTATATVLALANANATAIATTTATDLATATSTATDTTTVTTRER